MTPSWPRCNAPRCSAVSRCIGRARRRARSSSTSMSRATSISCTRRPREAAACSTAATRRHTPAFSKRQRFVVGGTLEALEVVMRGPTSRAFIPIGGLHHAARGQAAGFCVFNDCGVAVEAARRVYGLSTVAYVDIDAHHGDGVFYAFEEDPDLAFADLHEDGRFLYPGTGSRSETGRGPAVGTKLNVPMPPGAGDEAFMAAWQEVERYVDAAHPELIFLQCGADQFGRRSDHAPAIHGRCARARGSPAPRAGRSARKGTVGRDGRRRLQPRKSCRGLDRSRRSALRLTCIARSATSRTRRSSIRGSQATAGKSVGVASACPAASASRRSSRPSSSCLT